MTHYRSVTCSTINKSYLKQTVTLSGWVDKIRIKKQLIFIDLRDFYGITQVLVKENSPFFKLATTIKMESVIQIVGCVVARTSVNNNLATGEVEVLLTKLTILNMANNLPFTIKNDVNALEELRLQYRYLDLRRPIMQQSLLLKDKIMHIFRNFLHDHDFLDIETPCLVKPSLEGAREFIVPSRWHKHTFYTLSQSPQMYKQLLINSGIDKYYQIAKCFRDEDLRADRQPEFLQLDMEMAFVDSNDVMTFTEQLLHHLFTKMALSLSHFPLLHLPYETALRKYGSDKPDLRCTCEIIVIEDHLKAFFVDDIWNNETKNKILRLVDQYQGNNFFVYDLKKAKIIFASGNNTLTNANIAAVEKIALTKNNKKLCYLTNDSTKNSFIVLGAIRSFYCYDETRKQKHPDFTANAFKLIPLWITEWPLFDTADDKIVPCHHPFTSPIDPFTFIKSSKTERLGFKAAAYDLVINGYEIGGGSIRIHNKQLQKEIFALLQIPETPFNFFLQAFDYGFAPHGGIALGIDRLVMILHQNQSIRDSIAFPKNNSGTCLLTDAPSHTTEVQLKTLGLMFDDSSKMK